MKLSSPAIGRYFIADIRHATEKDIALLQVDAGRTQKDPLNTTSKGGCIIVWKYPDGYILHVDEPDTDDGNYTQLFESAFAHGYSERLVQLMKFTQLHHCSKLLLDQNGPTA